MPATHADDRQPSGSAVLEPDTRCSIRSRTKIRPARCVVGRPRPRRGSSWPRGGDTRPMPSSFISRVMHLSRHQRSRGRVAIAARPRRTSFSVRAIESDGRRIETNGSAGKSRKGFLKNDRPGGDHPRPVYTVPAIQESGIRARSVASIAARRAAGPKHRARALRPEADKQRLAGDAPAPSYKARGVD